MSTPKPTSFKTRTGIELSATLHLPLMAKPLAFAVFAHCFTCNKNFFAVKNISESLTSLGIAVFSFDFTGLGKSEGDFADTNFSSNVSDLVDACDFLQKNYQAPQLLIGHSLGGAAVLHASRELDYIKAIATIGAPFDVSHVAKHFGESIDRIQQAGSAEVNIGGRPFHIKNQFLEDINSISLEQGIGQLKRPLLIFHSPLDNIVSIDNASKIFLAAKHPKSFVSLDQADHLLSQKEDAEFLSRVLVGWAKKYITLDKAEKQKSQVRAETKANTFTTYLNAAGHSLIADEPKSFGGDNLGPSPYEYLLAGLGACTSMTLQMYAKRKKWPLENAKIFLEHNKIHSKDCEDCETKEGKVDIIKRQIQLEGDLNQEQRSRLLEIADKCPVHKTLHSEIKVETTLTE